MSGLLFWLSSPRFVEHMRPLGMQFLFAAFVLLLCGLMLLGANVRELGRNYKWVQQSDNILLRLDALETGVIGDELSVRGYALTDNPVFLGYQRSNRIQADEALKQLAAEDPSAAPRFDRLRRAAARHQALFGALTGRGPGHGREVAEAIVDPRFRAVTAEFRAALETVRDYAVAQLAERERAAAGKTRQTAQLAVGIVVAAFLFGLGGVALGQYSRRS
jgi:CHASE3 domain sensor protein